MPYTHTTFAQLVTLLAARLGDTGKVHWTNAELELYLIESIRVWNALTGTHRDTFSFTTTPGVAFYDLTALSPAQRGRTVVDRDLITLIEYQLMEPPTPDAWTGSDMFTLPDVISALTHYRDRFLSNTGCVVTRTTAVIAPTATYSFPDTVTSLRRVAWADSSNYYYQLSTSDDGMLTALNPLWGQTAPAPPTSYATLTTPNLHLLLYPPTPTAGTLDMITVNTGAVLDPTANATTGTLIGIPDDYAWGVRFGALAELLDRDGPARDPARADLCLRMYQLAESIYSANAFALLTAAINGVLVSVGTIQYTDSLIMGWQSADRSRPTRVSIAGPDLLALSPVPDDIYSVTGSIVRNASIPTLSTDYIQVSRDDLSALLGYAELLAAFKSQGASLAMAAQTVADMYDRAATYVSRRILSSSLGPEVFSTNRDDIRDHPIRSTRTSGGNGGAEHDSADSTDSADGADNASLPQSRSRSNTVRRRLGGR